MKPLDFSLLSVRQLLSLDACTRCGECVPACPVLVAAGEDHSTALTKITLWRRAWRGDREGKGLPAAAYDCTLCGRCEAVCPVYIRTHDLWIGQRRQLARAEAAPDSLVALAERVRATGNIAGRPPQERSAWRRNMAADAATPHRAGVVMFTGCLASLYPQAYALPRALLGLSRLAGVDVAVLGEDEVCCGFPLYAGGMEEEALALARANAAAIEATGAHTVITPCPSCYHTLDRRYPEWLGRKDGPRVLHGVEYLLELAEVLRPRLRPLPMRVTYHDPCDLGRLSRIYEMPRRLLLLIPGLELVEMADSRERALCCGGGGDVEMARPTLTEAIADRRLAQARDTGAEAIVTACSQCVRTLSAAARRARLRLRTYDVAELLLQSATPQPPEEP